MDEKAKPVSITITDAVKIDGKHKAVGDVLIDFDGELAKELAGAGRARLATAEEIAKQAKADAKAAKTEA